MGDFPNQILTNLLSDVPRRRKSLKSDENIVLKGIYIERNVAEDLKDFARYLELEESRLANAILKFAFSEHSAIQEVLEIRAKVKAIRTIRRADNGLSDQPTE